MSGRRESIAAAMVSGLARSMSARVSGTTSPARRGPRSRPSCPWAPRTAIFMGIVGSTGKNACATRNEPFLVAQAFLPVPPGMSPSWWHRHSCLCEYLSRETPLWLLRRRRRGGGRRWRRRRRGRLEERIAPGSTVVILPSLILKFSPSVLPVGGLYVSDVATSRRSRCFLVGSLPTYVY